MANNDMAYWASTKTGQRFFTKQIPNLIKALNENTAAMRELQKASSNCKNKPAPQQGIEKEETDNG